jgi:hypothetical protein
VKSEYELGGLRVTSKLEIRSRRSFGSDETGR